VRINFASVILHGPRRNGARQNLTVGPFGRALSWGCAVAFRLGRVGVGVGVRAGVRRFSHGVVRANYRFRHPLTGKLLHGSNTLNIVQIDDK
jgi:hypothetical protein